MREDINFKYFRERLEERQDNIRTAKETARGENVSVELDQARIGRLSRMDAMQQQAMSKASARLTDIESQRIKTALGKIESGEFGYCIFCDEDIALKRLEFDPSLLTCISCAQEAEGR